MTAKNIKSATPVEKETALNAVALAMESLNVAIGDAIGADNAKKDAEERKAYAGAHAVAALAVPGVLDAPFTFHVRNQKGHIVEENATGTLRQWYIGFVTPAGTDDKLKKGSFIATLAAWAGINDAKGSAANVLKATLHGRAIPAAIALERAGATNVRVEAGGALAFDGEGDAVAECRKAASLTGIAEIGKAIMGKRKAKPEETEKATEEASAMDMEKAYRIVKAHLFRLAALASDVDAKGSDDVAAPTPQQSRELLAPMHRDLTAIMAAWPVE